MAQPYNINFNGCTSFVNGDYYRSATDYNGCPCYEGLNGTIWTDGFTWIHTSNTPCSSLPASGNAVATYTNCDITTEIPGFHCPGGAITSPALEAKFETENSNIFLNGNMRGIILKDEVGGCWFIHVNSTGIIKIESVTCAN